MQPSGLYELEKDSLDAISAQLLQMIQVKSQHLYQHSLQVSNYAVSIAAKMGLPYNEIEQIRHAALLHDLGLLMIPNSLIQKSPYLNKQEMSKYKQHAASGANMIENYSCCQQILPYIRYHHEKWDGSGYPQGLSGTVIPLEGRITALVDVFDALGSDRCYKRAWPLDKILALIQEEKGHHFDPELVDLMLANLDGFLAIRDTYRDEFQGS